MSERKPDAPLLEPVRAYYTDKLAQHGATARGVDWNSDHTQELRFAQFLKLLPAREFSVGDLGCGYGGLLAFLDRHRSDFAYRGVDISDAMIDEARRLHAGRADARFAVADRMGEPLDYVVASGIFNVRQDISDAAWTQHVLDTVETMAQESRCGFAFNCLTAYSDADRMRDYLWYPEPATLFDHCMRRWRHVALLHDYGLYEFTLLVRKSP